MTEPESPPEAFAGEDLPLGEYIDVTLSITKWREVLGTLRKSAALFVPKAVWWLLGLGLLSCLAFTGVMWFSQMISFGLVRNFCASALFVILWPLFMILGFAFNEPTARFCRWYASSGRLDLVAMGKVVSFTNATHELGPPKFGKPTPGMLELRGPGYEQRLIRLTPSDAAILQALWARAEIAPAFGSDR